MAGRPERRRSALGAAHPIEARENAPLALSAESVDTPTVPSPEPALRALPAEQRASAPQAKTVARKAGFYADTDTIARIRAAWYYTPPASGEREESLSDFLLAAALDRMEQRELKYNDGEQFPAVPAGKIARGRR
jgi:hypothetical protein